jgi:hypothetical protein
MSGQGEQGEHFGLFPVLPTRVLASDRETGHVLTLLTPDPRRASCGDPLRGGPP